MQPTAPLLVRTAAETRLWYESLTNSQLSEECVKRGLAKSAKDKKHFVERLVADDVKNAMPYDDLLQLAIDD